MGLSTTTVGWFPKPHALRLARWRFAEGSIDEAELRRIEGRATRSIVERQESAGLDQLVEGQMDRGDMVGFFAEHLEGMEPVGLVRCFESRYYRCPRIVDDVARPGPIGVDHWKSAQELTTRPLKAVLTGPYTMMHASFDEHYGSRERCCMAFAEVVRAEAQDLADAGATEIQIDEPAISARPEEMALASEALRHVTAGLAGRARTWTHLCYGELLPVIGAVMQLPVDGLLLEMVNSEFELLDALSDLPVDKLLGAGVIDVHTPRVETKQQIGARIESLLEKIPAERLWLMPDTGLRTLEPPTALAKLTQLVETARSY